MSAALDALSEALAKDLESRSAPDRRVRPRVAITVPLTIQLRDGTSIPGSSLDLGLGGVCAATGASFPPEAVAAVRLGLRESTSAIPARGAWRHAIGSASSVATGIEFVELEECDQQRLADALDERVRSLTRFLVESPALAPIDAELAQALTERSRSRHFPADVRIYERGATGGESAIFIVANGEVALDLPPHSGAPRRADVLSVGSVFGGLPVVAGLPHADTAGTLAPCELIEVDRAAHELLRMESPRMARALERAVVRRLSADLDAALAPTAPLGGGYGSARR